jgi:hypothetical protein
VNSSGTFYVQVTTAEGSKLSQALVVVRNPNPTLGTQPASISRTYGQNATFTVSSPTAGALYQWQANTGAGFTNISDGGQYSGTTTATLTVSAVTADNNGNQFRCIVSTAAGCTAQSANAVLSTTAPTSVSELTGSAPQAYPNPAGSVLRVPVDAKVLRVVLSDLAGKEVRSADAGKGETLIDLQVGTLKSGVYFLQTESRDGKSPVQKIAVQ